MSPESLDPDLADRMQNALVPICGPYFGADEMRRVDALVAADQCLTDFQLMQLAGAAAFRRLRQLWPSANRIGVLCGTGNNVGAGWVIAKLIREAGLDGQIFYSAAKTVSRVRHRKDLMRGDARRDLSHRALLIFARWIPVHFLMRCWSIRWWRLASMIKSWSRSMSW